MHTGNAVLHNSLLALELTKACCSFVLFSPTPSIVFLVAVKKCAMSLSEQLVDHRPKSEMVDEVDVTWGLKEYRHNGAVDQEEKKT